MGAFVEKVALLRSVQSPDMSARLNAGKVFRYLGKGEFCMDRSAISNENLIHCDSAKIPRELQTLTLLAFVQADNGIHYVMDVKLLATLHDGLWQYHVNHSSAEYLVNVVAPEIVPCSPESFCSEFRQQCWGRDQPLLAFHRLFEKDENGLFREATSNIQICYA